MTGNDEHETMKQALAASIQRTTENLRLAIQLRKEAERTAEFWRIMEDEARRDLGVQE